MTIFNDAIEILDRAQQAQWRARPKFRDRASDPDPYGISIEVPEGWSEHRAMAVFHLMNSAVEREGFDLKDIYSHNAVIPQQPYKQTLGILSNCPEKVNFDHLKVLIQTLASEANQYWQTKTFNGTQFHMRPLGHIEPIGTRPDHPEGKNARNVLFHDLGYIAEDLTMTLPMGEVGVVYTNVNNDDKIIRHPSLIYSVGKLTSDWPAEVHKENSDLLKKTSEFSHALETNDPKEIAEYERLEAKGHLKKLLVVKKGSTAERILTEELGCTLTR